MFLIYENLDVTSGDRCFFRSFFFFFTRRAILKTGLEYVVAIVAVSQCGEHYCWGVLTLFKIVTFVFLSLCLTHTHTQKKHCILRLADVNKKKVMELSSWHEGNSIIHLHFNDWNSLVSERVSLFFVHCFFERWDRTQDRSFSAAELMCLTLQKQLKTNQSFFLPKTRHLRS